MATQSQELDGFSTLEFVKDNLSTRAPERDHSVIAPERDTALDAPQVSVYHPFCSRDLRVLKLEYALAD